MLILYAYTWWCTVLYEIVALILDTGISSNPSRNATQRWADIMQDLEFTFDGLDAQFEMIYQPSNVFKCTAMDNAHSYYVTAKGEYQPLYADDGYYYTVKW